MNQCAEPSLFTRPKKTRLRLTPKTLCSVGHIYVYEVLSLSIHETFYPHVSSGEITLCNGYKVQNRFTALQIKKTVASAQNKKCVPYLSGVEKSYPSL